MEKQLECQSCKFCVKIPMPYGDPAWHFCENQETKKGQFPISWIRPGGPACALHDAKESISVPVAKESIPEPVSPIYIFSPAHVYTPSSSSQRENRMSLEMRILSLTVTVSTLLICFKMLANEVPSDMVSKTLEWISRLFN
jgi:hypothetical protein